MNQRPAIVVIGYDRPRSIERLLGYLRLSRYPDSDVPLVISLDYCESPNGQATSRIAETFSWPHGPKRIIHRESPLGLRAHVLACGDLVNEYDRIIMLEDDLSVSLEYYAYAVAALDFTQGRDQVAGVALYSRRTNQNAMLPFMPLFDGWDNYYLQVAASWGQAWDRDQWNGFRRWYDGVSGSPRSTVGTYPGDRAHPSPICDVPQVLLAQVFYLVSGRNRALFFLSSSLVFHESL